jgi:predicted enzyme related to lactoylglutathione lyase
MISKVKFVSIPTASQDRALEFWTQKVGFKLVQDVPMGPEQRWIELEVPGAETHVVLFTPTGQEDRVGSFVPMAWATRDVEKTYEELRGRGVEFQQPPKQESWGTSAVFKDADGNQFVLSSE